MPQESTKLKKTVIKGPLFDIALKNAIGYTSRLIQKELREGGEDKIRQSLKEASS